MGFCDSRYFRKAIERIIAVLERIDCKLSLLLGFVHPEPTGFVIQQTGDSTMAPLAASDPGGTLVFTATPTPAGSAFPAGAPVPAWSSSDPFAVVTADPTGLIGTVVLDPSIAVGNTVTLSVSNTYTSANTGQRRPDSPPARSEAITGPPEAAASRHGPSPRVR